MLVPSRSLRHIRNVDPNVADEKCRSAHPTLFFSNWRVNWGGDSASCPAERSCGFSLNPTVFSYARGCADPMGKLRANSTPQLNEVCATSCNWQLAVSAAVMNTDAGWQLTLRADCAGFRTRRIAFVDTSAGTYFAFSRIRDLISTQLHRSKFNLPSGACSARSPLAGAGVHPIEPEAVVAELSVWCRSLATPFGCAELALLDSRVGHGLSPKQSKLTFSMRGMVAGAASDGGHPVTRRGDT